MSGGVGPGSMSGSDRQPVRIDVHGDSAMFGIEDRAVWLAYLLCLASALLCVVYGLLMWNRGDEEMHAADVHWAAEEKKVEEEL
jgi:hypothetical protein